jgi:hypothetical protein
MSDEPFKPPTASAVVNPSRIQSQFAAIGFDAALRASNVDRALEFANSFISIDPTFKCPADAVQLWTVMAGAGNYDEAATRTIKCIKLLKFILSAGGARYLNEPTNGLRPIDVAGNAANDMQRCILIRHAAEFGVDLNPTAVESPLYRGCVHGYTARWLRRIIQATDPYQLDWIDPATKTTPLHRLCQLIVGDLYDLWILESIGVLLACVGYINPFHPCFSAMPLLPHAERDRYLEIARDATMQYISTELLPVIEKSTMLPQPLGMLVVGYVF